MNCRELLLSALPGPPEMMAEWFPKEKRDFGKRRRGMRRVYD
jgi:hypothetical protein